MIKAKKLRKEIGDVGFEYRIRCWKDGGVWVIPTQGSHFRMMLLVTRLKMLGYEPFTKGTSGTAGEWIVEL